MCATPKSKKGIVLQFIRCESGATAIEYALIAAGIAVAISASILGLGSEITNDFREVGEVVK